jgi:hypothetical protein
VWLIRLYLTWLSWDPRMSLDGLMLGVSGVPQVRDMQKLAGSSAPGACQCFCGVSEGFG